MGYVEELRSLIGPRPIILAGSTVILSDSQGRLLLQQRRYPYGKWGLPGGIMELGESAEDTARREVREETGLEVGSLELVGVYSGADCFCVAENGDAFYSVTAAYTTRHFTDEAAVCDDESLAFVWFDPACLPSGISPIHRRMIDDYLRMAKG